MKDLMKFAVDRAKERSTWIGLTALLSAFGVVVAPDQIDAIATLGAAVAGAIGVVSKG